MRLCRLLPLSLLIAALVAAAGGASRAHGAGPSRGLVLEQRAVANAGVAHPALRVVKAAAGPTFSADYPGALVVPASSSNFTVANRPVDYPIDMVVIHVAEGSATGTAAEFQRSGAEASANYVVSTTGRVRQMVPEHDVAWHAGNWSINTQSIGIEHEGFTAKGGFTAAEYRGSASLLGSILDRYAIPPNRTHVIGHNQVPDPNHSGEFGGADHHTDPGRFWTWNQYMALARLDAKDTPQASVGLAGGRRAVRRGNVVTYAPALARADSYDLFAFTTCGWKPRRGARTAAGVTIDTAHGARSTTVDVGPKTCGRWQWLGAQSLAAGHPRSVRVTLPQHAGAPAIVAVETRDTVVPTLPAAISVSGVTASTALVSWAQATDNVGVWGYSVQVGGGAVQRVRGSLSLSATAGSLVCSTAYAVTVRAIDVAGNQSPAGTASFVTAACPPQPVGVAVTATGAGALTVSWAAPVGVTPSGYRVSVDAGTAVAVPGTSYTATGLACGTTHSFAVQLLDSAGDASQPVVVSGVASCVMAPTGLTVLSVSQTSAVLGWSAPSSGPAPAGYILTVGSAPGLKTPQTSGEIDGLPCGSALTGSVSSYDSAGNGSAVISTPVTTQPC